MSDASRGIYADDEEPTESSSRSSSGYKPSRRGSRSNKSRRTILKGVGLGAVGAIAFMKLRSRGHLDNIDLRSIL